MPHISNTPESLLPRSDSRNPATTCRGITTQGRPCRRALASPQPSSTSVPRKSDPRKEAIDQASLYCWQHRDQDKSSNPSANPTDTTASGKPRTSIDTLMDRLGVLEINDDPASKPNRRRRTNQNGYSRPKKKSTFCCFTIVEDSDDDRPVPAQKPTSYRPQSGVSQSPNGKVSLPTSTIRTQNAQVTSRPFAHKTKSWVAPTLSPETTSILLAELEKPISEADLDGYIYMFWVTPPTTTNTRSIDGPDTRDIASSLLPQAEAPENNKGLRPPPQSRSISEAIRAAQDLNALTSNPTSTKPGTLRLKIGRTSNVHRRMAEWTRQCSYDLTLIRYYPYTHVSGSSSPARVPSTHGKSQSLTTMVPGRKVPHVHRVERLIHLELEALRVTDLGQCPECGKEHREWFEVAAAKESLRSVDECIRKWISWAESVK